MSDLLRVLLVDDEELGRDVLRVRLEDMPGIEIIGEASNGDAAVESVLELRPDLVFLDVQMPGRDGLQVLEAVASEYLPAVVFVTAHDEYAIKAFELHALDYLLKPVSMRRLMEALERARQQRARDELAEVHSRVAALLDQREMAAAQGTGPAPTAEDDAESALRRIVVRDKEDYVLVTVSDIDALEAAGNYVRIVLHDRVFLVRGTLTEYERRLDSSVFVRVHRSTIVNADQIDRVTPEPHGDFTLTLKCGKQYRMSRSYRSRVLP